MNQHEWVEGCYAYYRENDLEPGNPEDGVWHLAHFPTPACLGGDTEVLLLAEHHAVQGVLQSEEYQHPCVYGWEKRYLTGVHLELYTKWITEVRRLGGAVCRTSEERRESLQRVNQSRTPERRREISRMGVESRRLDTLTPEERRELTRAATESRTPEQRSEYGRRGRQQQLATTTPEERSERARRGAYKGWETRRSKG